MKRSIINAISEQPPDEGNETENSDQPKPNKSKRAKATPTRVQPNRACRGVNSNNELIQSSSPVSSIIPCQVSQPVPLKNPLLYEVVIREVFKHLGKPCLLRCRKVCKKWKVLASVKLEKFNRKLALDFDRPEKLSDYAQMLEQCSICDRKLWSESTFEFTLSHQVNFRNASLRKIFSLVGHHIKDLRLTIAQSTRFGIRDFRNLLYYTPNLEMIWLNSIPQNITNRSRSLFPSHTTGLPLLPRLREIEIYSYEEGRQKYNQRFFTDLFSETPNLFVLKYRHLEDDEEGSDDTPDAVKSVFSGLEAASGARHSLRYVDLDCLRNNQFQQMIDLYSQGFHPTHLNLWRLHSATSGSMIEKLIRRFQSTLEQLFLGGQRVSDVDIEDQENDDNNNHPFNNRAIHLLNLGPPFTMKNLKVLAFHPDSTLPLFRPIFWQSIHYQAQFPQLEELFIYLNRNKWWESGGHLFFPPEINCAHPCNQLKSLRLYGSITPLPMVSLLTKIFPCISSVKIIIDSRESLMCLWTWTHIEYLTIIIEKNISDLDSAFTGIPNSVAQSIVKNRSYRDLKTVQEASQTSFSIRNLQKLRHLVFRNKSFDLTDHQHLSDLTGYCGLLHLNNLRTLIVNQCRITPECFEEMRSARSCRMQIAVDH